MQGKPLFPKRDERNHPTGDEWSRLLSRILREHLRTIYTARWWDMNRSDILASVFEAFEPEETEGHIVLFDVTGVRFVPDLPE